MPSADFCQPFAAPLGSASSVSFLFPRVADRQISPGNAHPFHAYDRRIYVHAFRISLGLQRYLPSHPACPPHALPVRRSSALPAASFRFHLAMDTLAVRLAVPLIGPAKVFHLLGLRPAGRTKKKEAGAWACLFGSSLIPLSDYRFRDSSSSLRSSSLSCFRVVVFLLLKTFGGGRSSLRTRARPGGTFFRPVFNAVSFRTRFLRSAAPAPARTSYCPRRRRSRRDRRREILLREF